MPPIPEVIDSAVRQAKRRTPLMWSPASRPCACMASCKHLPACVHQGEGNGRLNDTKGANSVSFVTVADVMLARDGGLRSPQ